MNIDFKRIGVGIGVVALLSALPLCAYFYVQSNTFRQSLSSTLSSVVGESVEIGDDLKINALYPRLKLSLPGAKLRAEGASAVPRRLRLQNLEVSMTTAFLISRGSKGELDVLVDSLSVIHDAGNSTSAELNRSDASGAVSETIAESLRTVLGRLAGLEITVAIGQLDFHMRDAQAGTTTYDLSRVNLASSEDLINASAVLHDSNGTQQQFELQISNDHRANEQPASKISGKLNLQITSVDQRYTHDLQANWSVVDNQAQLNELEFVSDKLWLRGTVSVGHQTQQLHVDSDLELRRFEFNAEEFAADKSETATESGRFFSYDLFNGDVPGWLDADVKLQLGAVRMDGAPVVNGRLLLKLTGGKLDITSEELYLLGGKSSLTLHLDNSLSQLVGLKLKFEADDMQLERIRSLDKQDTILSRGQADVIVALRGAGPSQAHIASSLNGYVIASVNSAEIKQKYASVIDTGIVSWAVDKLAVLSRRNQNRPPRAKLSDPLSINCAALRLYINDGRVEVSNGAIVEFPDNRLFSSGYVDLESEKLGFAFRTKSRSMFDWSAISIVKYAEVGGTLSKPTISLNERELVKQGVLSASSAAWGPLPSMVYSLAEAGVRNMQQTQCDADI